MAYTTQTNLVECLRGRAEEFIGWLWCNCRIWPNVVYFCNIVSHAVHIFLPSVLQRLDSRGIKRSSWSSERILIYCRYGLIIGPILLPSQVFLLCWGKIFRWCQIRKIWRVINQSKTTVMHNSHVKHRLACTSFVLVKQDSLRQFSRPFLHWFLFAAASTSCHSFPVDSLAFLKVVNELNTVWIPEDGGHHLPYRWHHMGLLWRGKEECFHCIVAWSLARSGGPNTHLGWGNVQENFLDLLQNVPSSSSASKVVAPTERKPSTCQECSLFVLGRCPQHYLSD